MKDSKQTRRSSGEAWPPRPGRAEPVPAGTRRRASVTRRMYSAEERAELLRRWERSGQTAARFARQQGMPSEGVLYSWRHAAQHGRELGSCVAVRNPTGKTRPPYAEAERVAAVSAYRRSGLTQRTFSKVWGVSIKTLSSWLLRVSREGDKGLKSRKAGRRRGSPSSGGLSPRVQQEIVATRQRFPDFGLKKLSQYLRRFTGLKVAPATVGRTLEKAGLPRAAVVRKVRRAKPQPRFFERARPNELWQSDITSLLLYRESRRVYLTVMLDDCSRYVVAFGLSSQQRGSLVIEALLDGIARFGKPQEVLTDQGRQYFSWRGKSDFQKVLHKEGIKHVISRSHHPETLGKCERLWGTVKTEMWDRCRPQDLTDARERLEHFFAHYNHFRPHQGLDGMVPADRFFGVESAVRAALEDRLEKNELLIALGEEPRRPVFLVGQIGEQAVSLRGEGGHLVIETTDNGRQEMTYGQPGNSSAARSTHTEVQDVSGERRHDGDEADAEIQEAGALCEVPASGGAGERLVGGGDGGGESGCAQTLRGDAGVLAGAQGQGGGECGAGSEWGASVATEPERGVGYAGGPAGAAETAWEGDHEAGLGETAGRRRRAEERERGAEAEAADRGECDPDPAGPAGSPGQTGCAAAAGDDRADDGAAGGKKEASGPTAESSGQP